MKKVFIPVSGPGRSKPEIKIMKKITEETKIKHQVKDYLKLRGYFVFHNLQGLGSYPGIPDFIAVRDGITRYIEIKTKKGYQSENQKKFEHDIRTHGGYYYIIRSIEELESWGI